VGDARAGPLVAPLAPGASARDRRRATPPAVVRLLDQIDLAAAAASLGIPLVSAASAAARTGRALRQVGTDDAYRGAVASIAAGLTAESARYGDLRRRFGPGPWTLPDAEWQRMRGE